jgi:hypothetical protein
MSDKTIVNAPGDPGASDKPNTPTPSAADEIGRALSDIPRVIAGWHRWYSEYGEQIKAKAIDQNGHPIVASGAASLNASSLAQSTRLAIAALYRHGCILPVLQTCNLQDAIAKFPAYPTGAWSAARVEAFVENLPMQLASLEQVLIEASDLETQLEYAPLSVLADLAKPQEPGRDVPAEAMATQAETHIGSITKDGACWTISFGDEWGTFPVSDFSAIEPLTRLLAVPHKPLELKEILDGAKLEVTAAHLDPVYDEEGIDKLRKRYDELMAAKAKAEADGSQAIEMQEINDEIAKLAQEIKGAFIPGGQKKKLGKTPTDKAWEALMKKMKRLWERIEKASMPKLAAHLEAFLKPDCPTITYNPPADALPWKIIKKISTDTKCP